MNLRFWKGKSPARTATVTKTESLGMLVVANTYWLDVIKIEFRDYRLFVTAQGPGYGQKLEHDFHRCVLYAPDGSVVLDYCVEMGWETKGLGTVTVVQPVSIDCSSCNGQQSIWSPWQSVP